MAEPYDTMLERLETVAEIGTASAKIICVLGRSDFPVGDVIKVDYGSTENTIEHTAIGPTLNGKSKGDAVEIELPGLPPSAKFWSRVTVEYDGTEYPGDWIESHTNPDSNTTSLIQVMSDGHVLEAINLGHTTRLAVMANTVANMQADADELGLPTLRNSNGDCTPFAKAQASHSLFPINEDGSTISGSNTHYAQSLTDTRRDCRLFKGIFGSLFRGSMFTRVRGNHCAYHWWHEDENNGSHNDAATHGWQAFNEHFGNIANSDVWSGDPNGRWGSMRYGPVLCCYADPGIDTRLSSSSPSSTPVQPDNNNDWTLLDDSWQHFFNEATGTIAKADPAVTPFIVFFIHNLLGTTSETPLPRYGWGGARYVVDSKSIVPGEVYETGPVRPWLNPRGITGKRQQLGLHRALREYALKRGIKVIVCFGHAHFYTREPVEGIYYVMCGRSAGANSMVGEYGFRASGGWWNGTAWTNSDPNAVFRSNAGHINIIASPKKLTLQYKKSIISPQISLDGFNVNNSIADEFTLYAESNTLRLNSPIKRRSVASQGSVRSHRVSKNANRQVVIAA